MYRSQCASVNVKKICIQMLRCVSYSAIISMCYGIVHTRDSELHERYDLLT